MILCKWQFAEISAEFMDVQGVGFISSDFRHPNEMSASELVTSVVNGEKEILYGNMFRVFFSSGKYSLY